MVYVIPKAAAYHRFLFQLGAVGGILNCCESVEMECEIDKMRNWRLTNLSSQCIMYLIH